MIQAKHDVRLRAEQSHESRSKQTQVQTPLSGASLTLADASKKATTIDAGLSAMAEGNNDLHSSDKTAPTLSPTAVHESFSEEACALQLLRRHIYGNATISGMIDAIHWASEKGYESVLRLLVRQNVDLDERDGLEFSALRSAAQHGQEDTVLMLFNYGCDIEATSIYGTTALHLAVVQGHLTVAQTLIDRGANVKATSAIRETSLREAARAGILQMITLLIERDAGTRASTRDGLLPFKITKKPRDYC
ncbi:MAG: hypothetical protein M1825_004115 [Sarcosagium campestre]|nr:MAG: hypothetical protein M1825_004115 [Sarcosagium campestre]